MNSNHPPYLQRMLEEMEALIIKVEALTKMVEKPVVQLDKTQMDLLSKQLGHMTEYMDTLRQRVEYEMHLNQSKKAATP